MDAQLSVFRLDTLNRLPDSFQLNISQKRLFNACFVFNIFSLTKPFKEVSESDTSACQRHVIGIQLMENVAAAKRNVNDRAVL